MVGRDLAANSAADRHTATKQFDHTLNLGGLNLTRFLYFDLGNVLVNFSHERMCQQVADVLGVSPEAARQVLFNEQWQNRYELGEITTAEFCSALNRYFDRQVPAERIERAASDIFWLNEPIVALADHLKRRGIPIGILSNTCSGHWNHVAREILASRLENFSPMILSYEVGVMKPSPEIYRIAAARVGSAVDEILFIDDRQENVEGARQVGFVAHHYTSVSAAESWLTSLGVI